MRAGPLLLILDEPTAALDAASEDALFRRYSTVARDARARVAITILISHRSRRCAWPIALPCSKQVSSPSSDPVALRAGAQIAEQSGRRLLGGSTERRARRAADLCGAEAYAKSARGDCHGRLAATKVAKPVDPMWELVGV
jgi:ABC-type taurine transport system ATPase subunit